MSITLTKEKHFIVLLSILDLGGSATKKQVLDNIQTQGYYLFSEDELAMKANRPEIHWRNDLAYSRKNLAYKGYINDSTYNRWSITDSGINYLNSLYQMLFDSQPTEFKKLTSNAIQKASNILNRNNEDLEKLENELIEDQMSLPNETEEILIKKIKRYKKIVDEIKRKYEGRCQIEHCGFTFVKSNGENYAEGHHLIPLAKGGRQNSDNVIILCANHHRMLHYANVEIGSIQSNKRRSILINGIEFNIVYTD